MTGWADCCSSIRTTPRVGRCRTATVTSSAAPASRPRSPRLARLPSALRGGRLPRSDANGRAPLRPERGSRFLEVDPVEGGGANDYEYALGDPCNNFDLDGRAVESRQQREPRQYR